MDLNENNKIALSEKYLLNINSFSKLIIYTNPRK